MPVPVRPAQSKPKVLFIGESCGSKEHDEKIRKVADVHWIERMNYDDSVTAIEKIVKDHGPFVAFGGLFVLGDQFPMKWDKRLLGALSPHCRCFVGPGAGYDKVDIDWLSSTGAYYANSPLAVGKRTADGALMLLLAAMRGMTPQDLSVRSGKWRDMSVKSLDWRESTIGIIGLGNIGLQLADMCSGLGMKIIYTSRSPKEVPYGHRELDELLAESDCVVLTCPLNQETVGLMNKETFAKMKKGGILVNVSRGPVVVEADLVEALESGQVMRAALDVFEKEPDVYPGLLSNPNVTLSPHVAPAPDSMGKGMNSEVIDNIIHFLEKGIPQTPVNTAAVKASRSI